MTNCNCGICTGGACGCIGLDGFGWRVYMVELVLVVEDWVVDLVVALGIVHVL